MDFDDAFPDDPTKPEFGSWRSYRHFEHRVRHKQRYIRDAETQAFIDTVLATTRDRADVLPAGKDFLRAQRGTNFAPIFDSGDNYIDDEPEGYDGERMKPRVDRATEGRANPAGVSVLYMGTSIKTVASEVRPWTGAHLSIAHLRTNRDLKAVALFKHFGQLSIAHAPFRYLFGEEPWSADAKEQAVWTDIDNAFSTPVTLSDDAADYVPTQILAEAFRNAGYDAIVYRSQFGGDRGYNVVLFNPSDADVISSSAYKVEAMEVEVKSVGRTWRPPRSASNQGD